jgi:glycosyltransferase involved in cell wall biosynthesis
MSILLDSFFEAKASGHGGNRRSAQILELLDRSDVSVTRFDRQLLTTARDRYLAAIHAVLNPQTTNFVRRHRLQLGRSLNSLAFCGFQRQLYDRVLRSHSGNKVLLWEATKNYVAPYVASDLGFKVIALPHNVEALVPNQNAFFEEFEVEAQALAKADWVFCIAREEEWLLRLKGANAYYLPYYPPKSIVENLSHIRRSRLSAEKHRFLILGTANNPPTRLGMIEQLNWLGQIQSEVQFQVDVVGYGTEKLVEHCPYGNITIHGAVSDAQLDKFLMHAKALLIHQKPSTGALTRIPEALIAGVPVIANTIASRSAFDYSGVYCYGDCGELLSLMRRELEIPDLPARPVVAEHRFIDCLQSLTVSSKPVLAR